MNVVDAGLINILSYKRVEHADKLLWLLVLDIYTYSQMSLQWDIKATLIINSPKQPVQV